MKHHILFYALFLLQSPIFAASQADTKENTPIDIAAELNKKLEAFFKIYDDSTKRVQ